MRYQAPYPDAVQWRPIAPWPTNPFLYGQDLLAAFGVPELRRGRIGDYAMVAVPFDVDHEAFRAAAMSPAATILNEHDQFLAPSDASEAVRVMEVQRCIQVQAANLSTSGVSFELVHFPIPHAAIGIVERVPTVLEVDALDENLEPIFSWSIEETNGGRPCLEQLEHPEVAGGILRWQWRIVTTHVGWTGGFDGQYLGPLPPAAIFGRDLLDPWSDLRFGHASIWGDRLQLIASPQSLIRYWVTFFGVTGRWRIHVGGKLSGYWQSAGRKGAALGGVLNRVV